MIPLDQKAQNPQPNFFFNFKSELHDATRHYRVWKAL